MNRDEILAHLRRVNEPIRIFEEAARLRRALEEIARAGSQGNPEWMANRAADALNWERQHGALEEGTNA